MNTPHPRTVVITLVLALLGLVAPRALAFFGVLNLTEPQSNSALSFEPVVFDLETILEGAQVSREFVVRNLSPDPVEIQSIRHCGCVKVTLEKGTLAAGEERKFEATLDSRNISGVQRRKIEVLTDEQEGGRALLAIKGQVVSPFLVRPHLIVQEALPGESTDHVSKITALDVDGEVTLDAVDGTFFNAALESQGGGNYHLKIKTHAPEQAGIAAGSVSLSCRTRGGETWTKVVPVRITVQPELRVLPSTVKLQGTSGSFKVTLIRDGVEVTEFSASDAGLKVELKRSAGKLLLFDLATADGATLPDSIEILLTTSTGSTWRIPVEIEP